MLEAGRDKDQLSRIRKMMTTSVTRIGEAFVAVVRGRGLHSSTFRLNVNSVCGVRRVHDFPPVY